MSEGVYFVPVGITFFLLEVSKSHNIYRQMHEMRVAVTVNRWYQGRPQNIFQGVSKVILIVQGESKSKNFVIWVGQIPNCSKLDVQNKKTFRARGGGQVTLFDTACGWYEQNMAVPTYCVFKKQSDVNSVATL